MKATRNASVVNVAMLCGALICHKAGKRKNLLRKYSLSRKEPVEHHLDGRGAWEKGVLGLAVDYRTVAVSLATMGSPLWLEVLFPGAKLTALLSLSFNVSLAYLVIFSVGGVVWAQIYLRKRSIRSLDTKYYLHRLTHGIRDQQTKLNGKLLKENLKEKISEELDTLLSNICEDTCTHFRLLTMDDTVGVEIRLASPDENDKASVVYKTVVRSKSLNPEMCKHSQPVPANEGIPGFFNKSKCHGVLIYNDLHEAAARHAYKFTKVDEVFPKERITMMVAPLNAWFEDKQNLIGLIHITSRKRNTFKIKHVDSLCFIADLTASAIANTMEIIRMKYEECETCKNSKQGKEKRDDNKVC